MSRKWVLPGVLVCIHMILVIAVFVLVGCGSGGEEGMAWGLLFSWIDLPVSVLLGTIDQWLWQNNFLWYSNTSWIFQFAHKMGWDHLNVGYAILYLVGGTIQWGLVGIIIQIVRGGFDEE